MIKKEDEVVGTAVVPGLPLEQLKLKRLTIKDSLAVLSTEHVFIKGITVWISNFRNVVCSTTWQHRASINLAVNTEVMKNKLYGPKLPAHTFQSRDYLQVPVCNLQVTCNM